MIILGIDPGTATTGWGLINRQTAYRLNLQNYGCISTSAKLRLPDRIENIFDHLVQLIKQHRPDILAVESVFFNTNAKTALLVGQARGAILLAGKKSRLPIYEYTPLQVKIAVSGYGRADKHQVQQMVKTLLSLKSVPRPDDAADALAVAITCALSISNSDIMKNI